MIKLIQLAEIAVVALLLAGALSLLGGIVWALYMIFRWVTG